MYVTRRLPDYRNKAVIVCCEWAALYVDSMIADVLARQIYAWQAGRRDAQRTEKREERTDSKEKRISKL